MKVIIFAGGTGRRFWPASRKKTPKQFLPITDNKPLIQMKYEYLRLGYKPEDIFLSTGEEYRDEVTSILSDLPAENFIFEPSMRDTGPAVLYATMYVDSLYPGCVISTQWSDHLIKQPAIFVKALQASEKLVTETDKTVVIAVPARFPSPHRGYIKFGKKLRNIDDKFNIVHSEFIRFVEKPSQEVAVEYVRSGDYAWNPGYFVTTAKNIYDRYQKFAPETYQSIAAMFEKEQTPAEKLEHYSQLEKISFDYIFAENLAPEDAHVVNVDMGWGDVGEWISLKEALQTSNAANVTHGNTFDLGSENSLMYNYNNDKLIATIGLKGMVVVNTQDVIAVFPQEDNAKIKEFIDLLEKNGKGEYL